MKNIYKLIFAITLCFCLNTTLMAALENVPAIRETDPADSLDNYVSLGEWNTDGDFESWSIYHISDAAVYGGSITGVVAGNDQQIYLTLADEGKYVNLSSGSVVEIRCRYEAGTSNTWGQWYIHNGTEWKWRLAFIQGAGEQPSDGAFHIYRANITADLGDVKIFRLDQYTDLPELLGDTFEVDYIRIGKMIPEGENEFTLWQMPSQGGSQMESYVMKSADGKIIVIDGGYFISDGEYLKNFLSYHGNHVDSWFLTHPHSDHVGALTWILSNQGDLIIDKIYTSFPPLGWVQTNEPAAAHNIIEFDAALTNAGRETIKMNSGDTYDIDEIHVEILNDVDLDITANAVNNASILMKVSDPSKTVLFLGDLGFIGGTNLLATIDHNKLKADYVQMAHHGQAGVGENFYQVVQPKYCLWPTPLWLWNNDNGGGTGSGPWLTLIVRQWMEDLNVISNFVSGFSSAPMMIFAADNYAADIPAIREIDPATPLDNYVSIGEWNTNGDFESWTCNTDISNCAVYDGNITGTVIGTDEHIDLTLATAGKYVNFASGSVVEVRCRYEAGTSNTMGQWYLNDEAWRLAFIQNAGEQPTDGAFHVYRATIIADFGEITSFRLNQYDQNSTGETFEVDYIRIKSPKMIDPTVAAGYQFYNINLAEWDTDDDFENWSLQNVNNATVSAGVLSGIDSTSDSQVYKSNSAGLPTADLSVNNIIQIRMKRGISTSSDIQVFYGTATNPGYDAARRAIFSGSENPQDGNFHVYQYNMSSFSAWESTLHDLRLDPTATSGNDFEIDYIRIGKISVIPEPATLGLLSLLNLMLLCRR